MEGLKTGEVIGRRRRELGMTQSQLLQEAQRIAGRYAPQGQKSAGSGLSLAFAAGMGVTGLAWIAALLLF